MTYIKYDNDIKRWVIEVPGMYRAEFNTAEEAYEAYWKINDGEKL